MKELLPQIKKWNEQGKPFVVARVVQTWGSAPRPAGSAMIVSADGEIAGSVSGGCVEGAVIKESKIVLATKEGKHLSYGVSDDEAWAVGLTCGGKIQVYLQPASTALKNLIQSLERNESGLLITELNNGAIRETFLSFNDKRYGDSLPTEVIARAKEAYARRMNESFIFAEREYFIHSFPPRNQLLVIGASHVTSDLVQLANSHDFETIVIDPRSAIADKTKFIVPPDRIRINYPSEVLNEYILDSNTYAVILSHDPKIDDDALRILLPSKAAYIGALGSRKTHEKRVARLIKAGFTPEQIDRIESPIGVDINAMGAREIALSIMGSLIRTKNRFL